MTQAAELSNKTEELILKRFPELKELHGADGGPRMWIPTQNNPEAGKLRIWQSDGPIKRVVYIGLTNRMQARHIPGNPEIHIDSHMIFAFADKNTAIPHFTLDSVFTEAPGMPAPVLAFHLDLIPRVDLGANLAYMDHVYGGDITEAQAEAKKNEGFTPAQLSSRQLAVMSPWMLASRATPEAFATIPVETYFEQWAKIVEAGVPADKTPDLGADDFAMRDLKNRKVLFNKDVDPVWDQIERAIGAEMGAKQREVLIQQDHDAE